MQINEYNCAVKHFSKNDVLIHKLMSNYGAVELKQRRNYFKALTTSIIGQQLSVQSAKAIVFRFNEHFNNTPTVKKVLSAKYKTLRSLGLSNPKTTYIKDLAKKLNSGEVSLKGVSTKNEIEVKNELTKVKGIVEWTVHMFLIFVLGKPDILPVGDLGIKKAIMLNYNFKNLPTSEEVARLAGKNNWSPYNTYASLYLWKSLDGN